MIDATAPWLNELEMRLWRGFLDANEHVLRDVGDSLKQRSGLTMDDYEVLHYLSEAEDQRMRMSQLSTSLLHSQSRLTQRVDRLAKRGLVCREKCADDGRGTFACLTDDGLAAITDAAPDHVRDVRRALVDLIDKDEAELIASIFERLASAAANRDAAAS